MPTHIYSVYILANTFQRLYIGMTNNLEARLHEHKTKTNPNSFTAKYNIDKLVYSERFQYVGNAIAREKELKGWLRIRKIQLITAANPAWQDLSLEWGKPTKPYREPK